MNKVYNLRVGMSEFEGLVDLNEVETQVYGEFSIEWKGQYPKISEIYISTIDTNHKLTDLYNLVDIDTLREDILATDDGSWHDDYVASKLENRGEDR